MVRKTLAVAAFVAVLVAAGLGSAAYRTAPAPRAEPFDSTPAEPRVVGPGGGPTFTCAGSAAAELPKQ